MRILAALALMTSPAFACLSPEVRTLTETAGERHGVDAELLSALFWQESRYCHEEQGHTVTSKAGALGIGQLMPGTAADLGVNPHDLEQNIDGAARYLQQQLVRFGSVPLALAAYNAGPANVERYGGVPPFAETQTYVEAVMGRYSGVAERETAPLLSAVVTAKETRLNSGVVQGAHRTALTSGVVK